MHAVNIDDDVFAEAERIAAGRRQSVDEVISAVSRIALMAPAPAEASRMGFPVLPMRDATPVTPDFVNQLRDNEEG